MSEVPISTPQNAVAIVGMAGRFPGARTPEELWLLVRDGREAIQPLSDAELRAAGVPADLLAAPNYVRSAAVLDDMEMFDADFFGFSPRDAAILDPQHRHFMECAWEVLEAAGYVPESFDGPIGVFGGCGMQAYWAKHLLPNAALMASTGAFLVRHTGNDKDFLTTRVSYQLNLRGPSVGVQTACSTSLVAVHLACQSLLSGECDMALAGGVTIELPHRQGYVYEEGEILSPDGHCRAFDASSKGTVFGSGVGLVALRRLGDALAAGDHVHAIILGSAVNNDGAGKVGYLAPSVDGQAAVVAEAIALADVDPETVTYIETHGTGTPVGDPIEVAALTEAFGRHTTKRAFCAIGSLKTNIGHLDTAAGVASLIKAVSAVEHGELPPSLHYQQPNPSIPFEETPFYVNARLQPWQPEGPRRAGVTSLGVGGTNAHVVIEQAPARLPRPAGKSPTLIVLSARSEAAVDAASARLAAHLEANASLDLADVAWTLQAGRRAFDHRRVLVCRDAREAIDLLRGAQPKRVVTGRRLSGTPSVVFLFPGGGAQYPDMGREIYDREPTFALEIDRGLDILRAQHGIDLRPLLFPDPAHRDDAARELERSTNSILSVFIVEYALGRLWMSWGVQPTAMTGHSLGEYAAACLAGVFSFEDALTIVKARGDIFERLPAGAMLSVPMSETDTLPWLTGDLGLAAANAPALSVVSGPVDQIDALESTLTAHGIESRRLRISVAAHSAMLEPYLAEFGERVARVTLSAPAIPFISNISGQWADAADVTRHEYWVRHLRHPVRFSDGLSTILREPNRVLIEVGPGVTLGSLARQHLPAESTTPVIASMRHPQDVTSDLTILYSALGQAWIAGQPVHWATFQGMDRRRVPLPTYPFEHARHWIDAPAAGVPQAQPTATAGVRPLTNWLQVPVWTRAETVASTSAAGSRWLILASDDTELSVVVNRVRQAGGEVVVVTPGDGYVAPRPDQADAVVSPDSPADIERLVADLAASGRTPTHILVGWRVASSDQPTRGFFALMAVARALAESGASDTRRLVVLTRQLQAVHDERAQDPEQALAVGAVGVLPAEMPPLSTTALDVTADDHDSLRWETAVSARVASQIVAEVLAGTAPRVALRRGERWTPDFARLPGPGAPLTLRENGTYLITGGLGGIALTIADALARQARVHLVLVGRHGLPPRETWDHLIATRPAHDDQVDRLRRVRAIEARGSEVVVAIGDVASSADLERIVDEVTGRFGGVNGVVHAAGVISDSLLPIKSAADAERVLAPKVAGTLNLARVLDDAPLDFWVNCSSVSAMVGLPGQFDYAAANAFLDAFAHTRAGDGPTVSINWQAWRDVGMLRDSQGTAAESTAIDDSFSPTSCALLRYHRSVAEDHQFLAVFAPAADWVLDEHRLSNGAALLPGTSYLAMAAEIAHTVGTRPGSVELRDVNFLSPFVVTGESRRLRVAVDPSGEFVMSSGEGSSETEHVRGSARLVPAATPADLDLAVIRARCPQRVADATPNLRHLNVGPRWATSVDARVGTREVIADLEFPATYASELLKFDLHPALLDVATALAPLLVDGYDPVRDFYVPLSCDLVTVHAPLHQARVVCHTRLSQTNGRAHDLAVVDVTICAEDGRTLVEIAGFATRRLAADAALDVAVPRASAAQRTAIDLSEAIRPEEGAEAFLLVLRSLPLTQVMVGPQTFGEIAAAAQRLLAGSPLAPANRTGPMVAPQTPTEQAIAAIISELLGVDAISVDDDFFELGGHSLLAVRLGARVDQALGVRLPLTLFFTSGNVRQLSAYVDERRPASPEVESTPVAPASATPGASPVPPTPRAAASTLRSLVPIHPDGRRTPVFAVHAGAGQVLFYRNLVPLLGEDRPFYGLQAAAGLDGREPPYGGPLTAEDLAGAYLDEMRQVRPHGPYVLMGSCAGGPIALEMAQRLARAGQTVEALVIFDSWLSNTELRPLARLKRHRKMLAELALPDIVRYITNGVSATAIHYAMELQVGLKRRLRKRRNSTIAATAERRGDVAPQEVLDQRFLEASVRVMTSYQPSPYHGRVALFRSATYNTNPAMSSEQVELMGWLGIAAGPLDVFDFPGDHLEMLDPPIVSDIARTVRSVID